jgi:hypothetical protein
VTLFVLWREPSYWPLALSGLAFFPVFHTLEQRLWFTIWPHFTEAWNQQLIWSRLIWGVPLGEILFHISLVAFCPLGVAYVRRSQVVRRHWASDVSPRFSALKNKEICTCPMCKPTFPSAR